MVETSAPALHVLCARPGLIRAGVAHPGVASHPVQRFTEPQLRELLAEPAIAVVYGRRLLPDDLADMFGATMTDQTRLVGGRIETETGSSAATDVLAHANEARDDMKRAEAATELAEDVASAEAGMLKTAPPARTGRAR